MESEAWICSTVERVVVDGQQGLLAEPNTLWQEEVMRKSDILPNQSSSGPIWNSNVSWISEHMQAFKKVIQFI